MPHIYKSCMLPRGLNLIGWGWWDRGNCLKVGLLFDLDRIFTWGVWREGRGIILPGPTLWRAFLGREAPGLGKPTPAQYP